MNDTLKSFFFFTIINGYQYVCDNRQPQINIQTCYEFETNKIQLCPRKDSNYLHIMQILVTQMALLLYFQ